MPEDLTLTAVQAPVLLRRVVPALWRGRQVVRPEATEIWVEQETQAVLPAQGTLAEQAVSAVWRVLAAGPVFGWYPCCFYCPIF
ncbi:hypothetical protein A3D03_04735 [Candidatus Gottesmanbacteria bacterium RIFCSPHIGHO2_02_FULL_40_13]|uniref:Uncharacterized protein n=1 Tax=Candidatus Gottesmanbacteria bacterium RIFCSPHIGHO2_02_FULL_40_13 TaxID=1798384 RepID=A0A1F6ABY4_9BACT|nr:MAG: hypothetical protein A3D03_04735 [Candidatus Gottesmanbacteria bacterium RIFCSPHIGHO2_02_FULL_40_13]